MQATSGNVLDMEINVSPTFSSVSGDMRINLRLIAD